MKGLLKGLGLIDKATEKLSSYLLVTCVSLMLVLTILTIILRWFEIPIQWTDPLVRHLVFFSAFLGGALATGKRSHIGIDILGKYLESQHAYKVRKGILVVLDLVSSGTCLWLLKASVDLVKVEAKYGTHSFLGLHSSILVAIIPVGFSLIAFRFFNHFMQGLFDWEKPLEVETEEGSPNEQGDA